MSDEIPDERHSNPTRRLLLSSESDENDGVQSKSKTVNKRLDKEQERPSTNQNEVHQGHPVLRVLKSCQS